MALDPQLISFASREAMAARLADLISAAAVSGPFAHRLGEIAVSGGSTPEALYEELASRRLPWEHISLTLMDERWVTTDHPRSNEAFVRRAFFAAKGVNIQGLYNGAPAPRSAVDEIASRLDGRRKPFDAVVLGIGGDGHTASWFPHAEGLNDALTASDLVCAVRAKRSDVTGDEVDRMTLTLSAIADAKIIILMITGDSKRLTFERALEPGPVEEMPVRAIFRARPDLWVCWAP